MSVRQRSNWFLISVGVLLVLTASAKLLSLGSTAKILSFPDPVFHVQFRYLMAGAGAVELLVAGILFFGRSTRFKLQSTLWLASVFILYRLASLGHPPLSRCPCLGTLNITAFLSPEMTDWILKGMLAYFAAGSVLGLLSSAGRVPVNGAATKSKPPFPSGK